MLNVVLTILSAFIMVPVPAYPQYSQYLRCPNCGSQVTWFSNYCNFCGARLRQPILLKICPRCKTRIPAKANFCPECGQKQELSNQRQKAASKVQAANRG
jgi:RNA polymerase subunit RPABC4/transcription elongation factor Spt4